MNREIDRLIVEKVLQLPYIEEEFGLWVRLEESEDAVLYRPSENIQDAWIVIDKVCKQHNWRAIIDRNQTVTEVTFKMHMGVCSQCLGIDESPMLAMCYACLETVGIENESETV